MENNSSGSRRITDEESVEKLLRTLEDGDCRRILQCLQQAPSSAMELAESCDVAQSTIYRKLDSLEEAGLVSARIRVNKTGGHTREYNTSLQSLRVECGASGIELVVEHHEGDTRTGNPQSLTQSGSS